ncbi:MAG: hypothetical protein ACTFAL_00160 [Candidatus Electronema sp. V4]|uniref:hypothetical protein n=1 Tax=Candidatus Electronema sp. V4 TaxID=3454756 RepID=UPI0040553D5B
MKKLAAALLLLLALSGCLTGSKPQDEIRVVFVAECGFVKTLLPLLSQGWRVISFHPVPSDAEKDPGHYVLLKKEIK